MERLRSVLQACTVKSGLKDDRQFWDYSAVHKCRTMQRFNYLMLECL